MASLTSQLILRLVDQLSGPANAAAMALSKTAGDVNKLGAALRSQRGSASGFRVALETATKPTERLSAAQRKLRMDAEAANRALRSQGYGRGGAAGGAGGMVAGIGARGLALAGGAYGVARTVTSSITSFADLDRRMRRVGLTADATGAQVAAATASVKELAMSSATPLDDVTKGLEALVQQGRSLPESMSFLPTVTRTAQAAGAEVEDIAKSADALASHLKISAGDMQLAFDTLVAGGKAGQFELKDMARYLPSLAPAAKALGLEGQKGLTSLVAMLQVIRKGSGTSEEAAASMNNILQKMSSEETRKRFKKAGVDLEELFKKGRKEGRNLLEVFEEAAWQAINGDLANLPKVINDMEFARGMRALLSMRGSWQEMAETIRTTAAGSTLRDFSAVAEDSKARIERLTQAWGNFKHSLGATLAPTLIPALESVQKKLDELSKESNRSSLSERRAAGRESFMAEAGRLNPLIDADGKYIGPSTAARGGSGILGQLFNPATWGAGAAGQRKADIDAARWRGVQAGAVVRIAAENSALAAPGRIEEFIRRQEGLRAASRSRASAFSGMAGATAREQVARAEAEIARLQGELAAARAKAADVMAKRAAAPGEIAALRSKTLSGAFGIDGPVGTSPGSVSPGLLSFGLGGIKAQANEARAALDALGNPIHASVDSSDIGRALQLARELNAELQSIGANVGAATRRVESSVRTAMRAAYSDLGIGETG